MKISLFIQLIVYLVYGVPLKIINIKTGWTIGAAGNIVVDDATPTTVWNVGTISGSYFSVFLDCNLYRTLTLLHLFEYTRHLCISECI